jgi:FMN phosphatase YigB (HAD superfamily)
MATFFYDIGDTLASAVFSADGTRLEALRVLPGVFSALQEMPADSRRGIISYAGETQGDRDRAGAALVTSGLAPYFDPGLIVYARKDGAAVFAAAATRAGAVPADCVFVGEMASERLFALAAGMRVAPHVKLALAAAAGEIAYYIRVSRRDPARSADWPSLVEPRPVVPLRITGGAAPEMLAMATLHAAAEIDALGYVASILRAVDSPSPSEAYLVRDDRDMNDANAASLGATVTLVAGAIAPDAVLGATSDGVYVAVSPSSSIDHVHLPGARHGHNERLVPDVSLLAPFRRDVELRQRSFAPATTLGPDVIEAIRVGLTAETIDRHHRRYSGLGPLEDSVATPIVSRHIAHADNARVVDALRRELERITGPDGTVRLHRFQHGDQVLHNVEAELPGQESDAAVLVTAHLDATGAFGSFEGPDGGRRAYDPLRDGAPGADDDASGVAAVLAVAELVAAQRRSRTPRRTVRFVLFNAEEQGLVGSKAYAREQAARSEGIAAVLQMDMVGYVPSGAAPPFALEAHAGFPSAASVESRSLDLASVLARFAPLVAPELGELQIYPDADEHPEDEAAGRSDHGSFQQRGYPGIVVSEDFFAGPTRGAPTPHPNPAYHTPDDRSIDARFTAAVARVVTAATLALADG